jgi:hypothetical protein
VYHAALVVLLAACKPGSSDSVTDSESDTDTDADTDADTDSDTDADSDTDTDTDTDTDADLFLLTLEPGDHGTLIADPAGPSYALDTLVTLTADPDDTYRLDAWSGTDNDASTDLVNTVTIDGNRTVGVTFAAITANTWTLTLSPGAGGSIDADPVGPTYADNTVVTLTANPDANFTLQSWTGTDDDSATTLDNTVTMHADTTVGATFVSTTASYTLTLVTTPTRANANTWGYEHADPPGQDYNVTNSNDPESTDVIYTAGTVVTLEAHQSASTWGFANWVLPDSSQPTTCSIQITMDADKTVIANFPLGSGVGGVGCP